MKLVLLFISLFLVCSLQAQDKNLEFKYVKTDEKKAFVGIKSKMNLSAFVLNNKTAAHIKKQSPDYIVGSSMAGYFAYLIGATLGIPTILFNPAVIGRSFDPVVDDSNLKETSHNVFLGKTDEVIDGALVQSYFSRLGLGKFTYTTYNGGHRVSAEVFIDAIKNVAGVLN